MKTPIEARDILKGDVIRVEQSAKQAFYAHAFEYMAQFDGNGCGVVDHYLLDRPTPHVELPTVPTLGRLTWRSFTPLGGDNGTRSVMAIWQKRASVSGGKHQQVISEEQSFQITLSKVISWEPAVAVPASALDELRGGIGLYTSPETLIDNFLAAVDRANGDAS